MSNYHVESVDKPAALTPAALKSLRHEQVQGMSRRQLMRVALGAGVGLGTLELLAGTVAFAWPNLRKGFGGVLKIGTYPEELLVAWLAIRLDRPVRWVETRSESMVGLGHGRGQVQHV